jgi:hypothetical protein
MPRLVELATLFRIEHGNKLDLNKMVQSGAGDDAIAFINRSGERGGLSAFVRKVDGINPYPAGLITVALGGSALASFVQSRPFYTGQNVDVLTPLSAMTIDQKLYYCLCVQANGFRYSTFGREANRTLRSLLVPDRDGIPPWVEGASRRAVTELHRDIDSIGSVVVRAVR